jgi:hypothetical protein
MLRPLLLAALVLPLFAAGCATSRSVEPKPAETVETGESAPAPAGRLAAPPTVGNVRVPLGETVQHDGHALGFAAITEDSRCPAEMTCVWQGRAKVDLTINGQRVNLAVPNGQASPEHPTMIELGMAQVWVIALHPDPGSGPATSDAPIEVELWVGGANG